MKNNNFFCIFFFFAEALKQEESKEKVIRKRMRKMFSQNIKSRGKKEDESKATIA